MQRIRIKVPGSIMLLGEHAVLFGELALACAVDKFIQLQLLPRADRRVIIDSSLAQHTTDLDQLTDHPDLSFVMAAVRQLADQLPGGFELQIRSDFSHTVGLGSSAAVTAGCVAALHTYAGMETAPDLLFERALQVVHDVQQGRGSGTDLVASIYGGLVAYRVSPRQVSRLPGLPVLGLYYAGYKTPTPEVLRRVEQQAAGQSELYAGLYRLMGQTSEQAALAIQAADWPQLGQLMNIYQGLMDALGVCDPVLSEMIYRLRKDSAVLGAKISGSGLGDCVLSVGAAPQLAPYEQIPIGVAGEGISIAVD